MRRLSKQSGGAVENEAAITAETIQKLDERGKKTKEMQRFELISFWGFSIMMY